MTALPEPGTGARIGLNLDSRSAPIDPIAIPFDPAVTSSYNNSTSFQVYDSRGNAHTLSLYFSATATTGEVNVYASIDGDVTSFPGLSPSQLLFDTSGTLQVPKTLVINIDLDAVAADLTLQDPANPKSNNAEPTLIFNIDFTGSTQFGSAFGVNSLRQDGYAPGELAGFGIGSDGVLQGRYTNGQTKTLGQVALANFANPQGLQQLGDNQWAVSPDSGEALVGVPGASGMGLLQSSSTEDSNVDLTAELVNMIVAQRAYQANAQTIKTQDAIQQTLMNLR